MILAAILTIDYDWFTFHKIKHNQSDIIINLYNENTVHDITWVSLNIVLTKDRWLLSFGLRKIRGLKPLDTSPLENLTAEF